MTWDRAGELGGRRRRWRGSLVHGGVVAALLAGLGALWATAALTAALLASPVSTLTTLERDGAWGVAAVLRDGTSVLVGALRHGPAGRPSR